MKRYLFNALVCISILFGVATVALWTRGYWLWDGVFVALRWPALSQIRNLPIYLDGPTLFTSKHLTGTGVQLINGSGFVYLAVFYSDDSFPHQNTQLMTVIPPHWRYRPGAADRTIFGSPSWNPHGFRLYAVGAGTSPGGVIFVRYSCCASDWALLVIFAILPGWRTYSRLLRPRRKIGSCQSCGYDMRATPQRCPECGALAAGAKLSDQGVS